MACRTPPASGSYRLFIALGITRKFIISGPCGVVEEVSETLREARELRGKTRKLAVHRTAIPGLRVVSAVTLRRKTCGECGDSAGWTWTASRN